MKTRKSIRQIFSMIAALSVNDTPSKRDIGWIRNEIKSWFSIGTTKRSK